MLWQSLSTPCFIHPRLLYQHWLCPYLLLSPIQPTSHLPEHHSPGLFPSFTSFPPCSLHSQNLTAALRKNRKKKKKKEKKNTNPPSSPCSHASQVRLSIPLLYLPRPVFHRNVSLVGLTSSPCLMRWHIYSDRRRELRLKWKVSVEKGERKSTVSWRMEEKTFPCMKRWTLDQRHWHWRKTTVSFDKVTPEWHTAVIALHNGSDNKERAARLMSNPPPFSHIYTHPSMKTPEHEICPGPRLDSGTVPSLWLRCAYRQIVRSVCNTISISWHTFMHAYARGGRKDETCHLLWKPRRFFCEVQVCECCHSHFKQPQPHHTSKRNRCKGGKGRKSERCGKQDGENTQGFELHARCCNVFKMMMVGCVSMLIFAG